MAWAIGVATDTGIERRTAAPMNLKTAKQRIRYWTLVASAYVLMNLGEDASVVAFMFC